MRKRIVADSSCGISIEEGKKIGVEILPLIINFGKESYRDILDINNEMFYEKLKTCPDFPTTSQPPFEDLLNLFEDAKKNQDILFLLVLSSKISGTYQSALLAKETIGYENIYIIKDLMEPQAVVDHIVSLRKRTRLKAAVDTLEYFCRGGRVSRTSAFFGDLLNIKPLIAIDKEGYIVAYDKKHGLNKALNFIVEEAKNDDIDENYPIYFGYCMDDSGCDRLIEKAKEKLNVKEYTKEDISPVIGVHVGTNAAILVYVSKKEI